MKGDICFSWKFAFQITFETQNAIAITFIGRKISFLAQRLTRATALEQESFKSQSRCQKAFSAYERYGFLFLMHFSLCMCDDVFLNQCHKGNILPGLGEPRLIISFSVPGVKNVISQAQRKMQFLKNFLKKKTISIIGGKCFLPPRLTLGLPPLSKKNVESVSVLESLFSCLW